MIFINRLIHALFVLHPLHTMVVHFPIGLTGAALFFIFLAVWRKNSTLEKVAFADLALASVSVVAAGLTGMRDNLNIYSGAAPNVNVKITLAIILLAISAATSIWRWKNPGIFTDKSKRWIYIGAFVLSFLLVAVIGFLGGVIVYGF
ncbi:MAG: hypothetical protein A2X25_12365 [Chloroflexi bacterium GWB2_49_20]|nr:MAG: hypothetical protein A2X25_12365 [Chloroflexi bacterium GWB2_49_20]OGN78483.1 MAG: hypothetical protein A2X26_01835 [Chloroflexi bacterium GWC2_49_37]OGN84054.1 MAG: hypothetical protein A2X27_13850 [Chloroflexi bacterium GWD2_49_16]HBG75302.1 hypothetical protein [Anaerolineae bacterium]HCC79064.1 hypothetical protein [Anaerolineae bacterium]